MHALVKKNKNAERYSQNSCQDIQKEFQHFVDPWPFRDADSQVTLFWFSVNDFFELGG